MGFTLSNTFVQEVKKSFPDIQIYVKVIWWDDDGKASKRSEGIMAQLSVVHHVPYKDHSIQVNIKKEDTNEMVLNQIRKQARYLRQ